MAQQCSDMDVPKVLSMGRSALVEAILGVDCDFPVDFSQAELRSLSLEKLRHIYLALLLHGKRPKAGRRKRTNQPAKSRAR